MNRTMLSPPWPAREREEKPTTLALVQTEQRRIMDTARRLYSTEDVRRDLRRPLSPNQSEEFDDVILLASFLLSGHIGDLSPSLEWFGERLAIDHPDSLPRVIPFHPPQGDHLETSGKNQPIQIRRILRAPIRKNTDNVLLEKKTPTMVSEKTPTYYVPVVLWEVVSYKELEEMLHSQNQSEWTTSVRLNGLLLLLDFLYRRQKKSKTKGILVSHELASGYVSELNRPENSTTLRRPLAVLVKLGIIEIVEEYKRGLLHQHSTRYRINPIFREKAAQKEVRLTPKLAAKWRDAPERQRKRLNTKHPWRERLIHDIGSASLTQEGMKISIGLLADDNLANSTKRMHSALSGEIKIRAIADPFGTILTEIKNFPRVLKPHLSLDGNNVALCDISYAHWCLLPLLLDRSIRSLRDAGNDDERLDDLQAEQQRLQAYLSEGDLYRKLSTNPHCNKEREKTKSKMLRALNHKNTWNRQCSPYQQMKAEFPHTFGELERMKRADHKAITPFLQGNTAIIVRKSLLRCQELGIPAIPDTDCIICPEEDKATVCQVIGEVMYRHTGVRCRVG